MSYKSNLAADILTLSPINPNEASSLTRKKSLELISKTHQPKTTKTNVNDQNDPNYGDDYNSCNNFELYIRDIRKKDLISKDKELELGLKIKDARKELYEAAKSIDGFLEDYLYPVSKNALKNISYVGEALNRYVIGIRSGIKKIKEQTDLTDSMGDGLLYKDRLLYRDALLYKIVNSRNLLFIKSDLLNYMAANNVDQEKIGYFDEVLVKKIKYSRELVEANYRLVIKIAKGFKGRGVAFEDLIQIGNESLMIAAEKYDPLFNDQYCKFSSYASMRIVADLIKNSREQSNCVKISYKLIETVIKYNDTLSDLENCNPIVTSSMLAEALGWSEKKVNDVSKLNFKFLSFDSTFGTNDKNMTFKNIIPDERSDLEDKFNENDLNKVFNLVMENLTQQEKDILRLRSEGKTLQQIGNIYLRTKERIRQIEKKVLNEIRKSENFKELAILWYQ